MKALRYLFGWSSPANASKITAASSPQDANTRVDIPTEASLVEVVEPVPREFEEEQTSQSEELPSPDLVHSNVDEEEKDELLPYIPSNQPGERPRSILAKASPDSSEEALRSAHVRRSVHFPISATPSPSKSRGIALPQENGTDSNNIGGSSMRSAPSLKIASRYKFSPITLAQSGTRIGEEEIQSSPSDAPANEPHEIPSGPIRDLTGAVKQVSPYAAFEGSHSSIFPGQWEGRKVAIKIPRGMRFTAETNEKVEKESEIWYQLHHENILTLYGFSKQFGRYGALIYPWCERGNAGNYLRGPVKPSRRFRLWCDVVRAIQYLHCHDPQVVHGDLKPANVLIGNEEQARVCDFGLVQLLAEETMGMTTTSAHISGMRYLAHELVMADEQPTPTTASDIHALGCLGLEFLFLRIPYANRRNPAQIYKDIADKCPPSTVLPVAGHPSVPIKQFWDMLNSCWNADPKARPSAQELQEFVEANEETILAALDNDFVAAPGLTD